MKNEIHPQYFTAAKVVCACGNSFITGSTQQELHVEICYNCHPFYTGKQNLIDTSGTIDRFKKRSSKAAELKSKRITKKLAKA
ncbi:MAG: 50S ribosomal protein L31 [Candidatus Doudnabacteria bacterium RIFCSPLOWO2_02_FULL_42_9]|uniref:Large ribosomal subunit protein bL31 n=1 Tax=Candidatus Doudnabacteria bacterium RIFCSPHIGHO2_01_FULL_41_86 TaxID=1817821 RepID=A0A1F5N864_9BACT|nr:MAG: 50S ribosomal protein L31 [Candidatus Doudnabacteria bacterium RIFCSPHIGHO2_01_FULL_41_86]OGE74791.1 MAG: 50S ribosomal protein L31 [Candidatus Doudnabacteria bacterium RIFCSPHIGHO2_01_43_10]OGE85758.1 MAG: 50S ribosomal protein L31 [Candidatus Doudnabacteria bacterium RIFCSPHIGHO2_12_FULL_42_22]OGE87253.1 MAG: 50S ribosomal protein L31 [Candidatus Doudnabacteria bacterium RIFCSPHIGHO2_02_FULL_42_25]OGE92090.1 MAG: 50S ribosomal protein L31 [Candidatus Doudnabacteria bacterium RIFCSPLOW